MCAPAFASWLRPAGQFRTPERETDRAVPSAGCEPVEETGQGFACFRPHSSKHRAGVSEAPVCRCESGWGHRCLRVWFKSRMRPCQGRDDGATPFTRSIGWGRSSSAEVPAHGHLLTCERQGGQHSCLPPFPEGVAQPASADASPASGRKCESSCPHHLSGSSMRRPFPLAGSAGFRRVRVTGGRRRVVLPGGRPEEVKPGENRQGIETWKNRVATLAEKSRLASTDWLWASGSPRSRTCQAPADTESR